MRSSLSRESELAALLEHLLEEIRTAVEVMAIRAAGDIPERGGDVQLGGNTLVACAPSRPALQITEDHRCHPLLLEVAHAPALRGRRLGLAETRPLDDLPPGRDWPARAHLVCGIRERRPQPFPRRIPPERVHLAERLLDVLAAELMQSFPLIADLDARDGIRGVPSIATP